MSETIPPVKATGIFTEAYKKRVFNAILVGQIISIIGSGITGFALRVWAFERTDSVTQFALVTFFYGVPGILLAPIAGAFADRYSRRLLMIVGDCIAGFSTLGMWLLFINDNLELWHVYTGVALISVGGTFQGPAYEASIPLLVPKERLGRANGMTQIGPAIGRITAPLFAGVLLVVVGMRGIMQFDLLTFFVAICIMLSVRIPQPPVTELSKKARESFRKEISIGWQWITAHRGFVGIIVLFSLINFTQGMVVVLIAPMVLSFSTTSTLGVVLTISGVGALLGALLNSLWGGPKKRVHGLLGFSVLRGALLLLGGLQPSIWLISLASASYLFLASVVTTASQTLWQEKTPKEVQGRVFAVRALLGAIVFPGGQILAGPLADNLFEPLMAVDGFLAGSVGQFIGVGPGRGIGLMLIVLGIINLVLAGLGYLIPSVRNIQEEIPDAE